VGVGNHAVCSPRCGEFGVKKLVSTTGTLAISAGTPLKHPLPVLYGAAHVNDVAARLLRRDLPFALVGVRMAELMSPLDHGQAERELGWWPEPVEESIRKAACWFADHDV